MIRSLICFISIFALTVNSFAVEQTNPKLLPLQNFIRVGDKLVKQPGKSEANLLENKDYIIKDFKISENNFVTTITFKILPNGWLAASSHTESGVYIYNGTSPAEAKLCAVSCVGGNVKIILDRFTVTDRWFFAGPHRRNPPVEILINGANKSQ